MHFANFCGTCHLFSTSGHVLGFLSGLCLLNRCSSSTFFPDLQCSASCGMFPPRHPTDIFKPARGVGSSPTTAHTCPSITPVFLSLSLVNPAPLSPLAILLLSSWHLLCNTSLSLDVPSLQFTPPFLHVQLSAGGLNLLQQPLTHSLVQPSL